MRPSSLLALPLAAVLALTACAARRIPGTDIEDTEDTRAIIATIEAYRQAAERRDAEGVMAVVSEQYFDRGGTVDPGDDLDHPKLAQRLADDYRKISALRLDIGVKRIDVDGDRAQVYVFYEQAYRIALRSREIPKQGSDVHRMQLARENGAWRITSGI
jgi:hypothetical protein